MYNNQKMSMEQLAELQNVLSIVRSAKSVRRKTINGAQYNITLYTDASRKDMQLIFGYGGWLTEQVDWPLKECPVLVFED